MAAEVPIEYRIRDAISSFIRERAIGTESEGQEPFSEETSYLLAEALKETLGDQEPRAYAMFEDSGQVWGLIVIDEAAYRLQLVQGKGSAVELESLGTPCGGSYTERFTLAADGEPPVQVQVSFSHPKLSVHFEQAPLPRRARPDVLDRRENLERLRLILRSWSRLPEAP